MRGVELVPFEIESMAELPTHLQVGGMYFVKDIGQIIVNHGDKIVSYPAEQAIDINDFEGVVWPVSAGGTGATTPGLARVTLQAMGFDDNAASASKLATPKNINLTGPVQSTAPVPFDGSADIAIPTYLDTTGLELTANKVTTIRNAAFADDNSYPTESAARTALDLKADKSEIGWAFKGVFPTSAELIAAYPVGQPGWNATVTETNTMWIWVDTAWSDVGDFGAVAVQTVNGILGPDVLLDIETNLDGYKTSTIDTKVNTLTVAINEKQDALATGILGALVAATSGYTPNASNYYVTKSEMTTSDNDIIDSVESIETALTQEISDRESAITEVETSVTTQINGVVSMVDGAQVLRLSSNPLVPAVGGETSLSKSLFPVDTIYSVGRTLIADAAGTLAVVTDLDSVPGSLIAVTSITSATPSNIPVLLGNVDSYYDLPMLQTQIESTFSRSGKVTDRARAVADERHGGATVEYTIMQIGQPVTVLLGVRENLVGNDPATLIPTVTAALALGFITPMVGDRYGLYTNDNPKVWTRYYITAIGGDNITWGPSQPWTTKDGDDIPTDFTVRPDVEWGAPLIINTSNYQAPTTLAMTGQVLTGGVQEGTFGAPVAISTSILTGDSALARSGDVADAIDSKITFGTVDLTAGTSSLETGSIYLVYE